jgi:phospholipid:diacylglycerol acyltransferase
MTKNIGGNGSTYYKSCGGSDCDDWESISEGSLSLPRKYARYTVAGSSYDSSHSNPKLSSSTNQPNSHGVEELDGLPVEVLCSTTSSSSSSSSKTTVPFSPQRRADSSSLSLTPQTSSNIFMDDMSTTSASSQGELFQQQRQHNHVTEIIREGDRQSLLCPIDERRHEEELLSASMHSTPKSGFVVILSMLSYLFRCMIVALRRFLLYAFVVWIGYTISLRGLKQAGIVEHDFELHADSVVHRVMPHLTFDDTSARLSYLMTEEIRPGYHLAQKGARAKYPIVMVPGFVTSGLEVWGAKQCAKQYFRQRFWTALTSARTFLMDTACWNEHMKLDPYTGGDPDGGAEIRLRASEGFAAADYFMANYWVWGKLIENLADVGYTPSTMTMEPYDWRLPFHMLEERDGYFTKLKYRIEAMKQSSGGTKVVLATHSMGALVMHHFFAWVTHGDRGRNKNWVDEHIHTYINIAGCHLGVPKAATALLSGEMKDTVLMGATAAMVEQFFGRRLRRNLWSSWGSLWAMLPKGGDDIWGQGPDMCTTADRGSNDPFCPERSNDPKNKHQEYSAMIAITDGNVVNVTIGIENAIQGGVNLNDTLKEILKKDRLSTNELIQFLQTYGSGLGPSTVGSTLSLLPNSKATRRWDRSDAWHDPTRTPLPHAPNMKIYCFYGTGLPTERAFQYRINWKEDLDSTSPSLSSSSSARTTGTNHNGHPISDPPILLDATDRQDVHVQQGIRFSDGDGSVPLVSLGYICTDAWQRSDSGLNPSRIKVYTREYKHEKMFTVDDPIRGGPRSSDHVDILGNLQMTEDFVRLVTEFESADVRSNHIVSDINRLSTEINKHGGIYNNKFFHRVKTELTRLVDADHEL